MTGPSKATQPLGFLILFAFIFLGTPASAQFLEESKRVKLGLGCQEPVKAMEAGLGVCMISATRARVWCPNGKVYERTGALPDTSIIRSVCDLRQIL